MHPKEKRSCLYRKISHYVELTEQDMIYLEGLETNRRTYPARQRIRRPGEEADILFIVRRGWLYSASDVENERRHIQGLHFPGDVIGISDITLAMSRASLITATEVELCRLPKSGLRDLFETSPRLAALFFAFGAIESVILTERLAAVSRLDAEARLSHMLLQIHSRILVTAPENGDWFRMPLSQEVIGDAIGLTQAYVNRTFKALEARGLIERHHNGVELLDKPALIELSGYEDRYSTIDQGWMPQR
ncbi:Crp/Fnr family transcriptional regulator [Paracoccus sediminicola]|uniref:Crp/Fnr family transcriptional regulator n=1 Tax=Paracoccus sediminicola TaxID=3017783 RepID=UPI0022F05C70|nr:Crp/Fnr family transcriptional regulator [Paracoccus sediminicola]WBU55698.1 Crp/Fnr family transcriptional regulator [Paracoccus sediminicola]